MKILVTTPYFYPEGGGLERYAYNIFKRLAAKGYEITVYCATKKGYDYSEELDGIKVHRLKPNLIISNTPIRFNLYSILSKELDNGYDIVNSHTPVPYFAEVASLVASRKKIDYIVTFHVADMISPHLLLNIISKLLSTTLEPLMFKKATKIITVSDIVKYGYLANFAYKTEVIPPGVDTDRYKPGDTYNPYSKKLLFIAPLSSSYEWKGLRVLLNAMRLIVRYHPDTILTIIGDGPLREEYINICRHNGIESNVIFKGRVSEDQLIKSYQESSMLIVPSTTDTDSFTIVSLEANACGIPVVASRVGGIPYYVKDGINGFLVEPGDSDALAKKVIELLSNPVILKELSPRCRERALEFDWQKAADATMYVLEEVVNEYE
ncbi:MAG: glycosyltransferase family 4 protein [Candidatus Nitrosocaldaceae archaeon]